MGPDLRVSLCLLIVAPVSALRNLCMCLKFLSVRRFFSRTLPNCVKNLKLGKIIFAFLNLCMCVKYLFVGCFAARALPECDKNIKWLKL